MSRFLTALGIQPPKTTMQNTCPYCTGSIYPASIEDTRLFKCRVCEKTFHLFDPDLHTSDAPIFVSPLVPCLMAEEFQFTEAAKLFGMPGNHEDLLHDFARETFGLTRDRHYKTPGGNLPHYRLNRQQRREAIAAGAQSLNHIQTTELMLKHRAIEQAESLSS